MEASAQVPTEPSRTWSKFLLGPFQTPHHALAALVGLGGIACFSVALVQQKPFDATLAVVLVLLCRYIFALLSERIRQKSLRPEGTPHDLRASVANPKPCNSRADGISELDLTGYAKTLGVSLRTGTGLDDGGTLSKILMDALAKEYLRCVSALKCYQNAFGPLQEDASAHNAVAEPTQRADRLSDLVDEVDIVVAPTPRSPMAMANPPSPDPRRRLHTEAQSSVSKSAIAPATASSAAGLADRVTAAGSRSSSSSGYDANDHLHSQTCDDEKPTSPLRQKEERAPRGGFGLFGS